MYKRAIVQVWSVDDPEWFCKISEGRAGLAHSRWGPHERHILNTNEFNVRVSVWDLSQTAGVVASLSAPKFADKVAFCSALLRTSVTFGHEPLCVCVCMCESVLV
jgi:hypothetical protein